jgi:sugar transferase (PEP-CTERM/EpsH1 system associated)
MKILFLTQRVPFPPNKGDKLRAFNIIKYLSKKHSVSLVCLADNKEDLGYTDDLGKVCSCVDIIPLNTFFSKIRSLFYFFSNLPLTLAYFYSGKMKKLVKEKIEKEKFDLIFIYCSSMAQYALNFKSIPKIIDFVDVDSDKWRQYADYSSFPKSIIYKMEERRLKEYEKVIVNSVNHSIVTSQAEAELFKSFIPGIRVSVLPNGVDYEYYKPDSCTGEKNSLVFMGQMNYFANVEGVLYFCREILPLIRKEVPDIRFYVVGSNPVKAIKQLTSDKNVVVTGFVDDVRPYVVDSAVCVVPLRIARGIQNKVLEAMASGVPVVTTTKGNEGINAKTGEEIFINDNPEDFAESVLRLMDNPQLRASVSAKARRLVENKFSWELNLQKLENILLGI